ncbi:winged helix-turn-helix domain-containing protein [Dysgonomonas macrotermitis]|uniref:DNA-binding transcriptional regulator, MarR family n=1 Tax=Dysgonomonas macrotermitis TaxID=1346286 RepID=A0A1M4TTS1_9BACT|nr:transcriptional regulator [Dysgonomonas macrotermitis]SHE47889.1 DNA-binding transcriptional regulator, MarR family [Dysgonomonas macrotermitis]
MFKELDPLLHSQLRLAIMSLLISVEEADFVFIREKTNASAGNLSVQIDKLSEAGYINVNKFIDGKRPRTMCKITKKGIEAFDSYVKVLREYIGK